MNIDQAWAFGRRQLSDSPTPDLDARLLLQHVLQVGHSALIAHGDRALSPAQEQQYRRLIEEAKRKTPLPYLIGTAPFMGQTFKVTPGVLIPRPETEQLVEAACRWAGTCTSLHVVDVGTGSGCIAVSLARLLPNAIIDAVDISADALAVARSNVARLAPGRIQFHRGHLLEPLSHPPDLVIANLPYIADGEWTMLDDGVKWYEPAVALRGGADGLDLIRQLLQQAASRLSPGGAVFLEIGWQQGPLIRPLAQKQFPAARINVLQDYAGRDRIVAIETGRA